MDRRLNRLNRLWRLLGSRRDDSELLALERDDSKAFGVPSFSSSSLLPLLIQLKCSRQFHMPSIFRLHSNACSNSASATEERRAPVDESVLSRALQSQISSMLDSFDDCASTAPLVPSRNSFVAALPLGAGPWTDLADAVDPRSPARSSRE